jgi:hypothetical protein
LVVQIDAIRHEDNPRTTARELGKERLSQHHHR